MNLKQLQKYIPALVTLFLGLALADTALAATTVGTGASATALSNTFTAFNDMVNGYGTQLLVLIAFVFAAFGIIAMNAGSVLMKYVGIVLFLATGLGTGLAIAGTNGALI